MYQPKPTKINKKFVPIAQSNFPKGYISTLSNSRMPLDGLAKMTNMWLEQDSVPRPRPPFIPYGEGFVGTCIGNGTFVKTVDGRPQYYEISMQVTPTNEVQTISITGSPTGGTFTLTFDGHTTGNLNWNATASQVQTALQALSNIGSGNVACGGGALPGSPITITFQGTLANTNVDLITSTSSLTGGSSPTIHIAETQKGGSRGLIYTRKDGGAWTAVTSGTPNYDPNAETTFTAGAAVATDGSEDQRVYINNASNNMSYYDISANAIVQYVSLATPAAPSVTASSGLTGSNFTQYYGITANGPGGESAVSLSGSAGTNTARDFWSSGQSIALSWSTVAGADSYSIYTGDINGQLYWLATVSGTTFTDDGTIALNIFKAAPVNDSSAGPRVGIMVNYDNQLFGCLDPDNPSYLWYSGQGQHFGDFGFNPQGGGYVGIDYGGDTLPTYPFGFQDGKGNPVLSILTYGQAGRGKLFHFTTTTTTIGTTTLTYPNVYEASSQDGTPASRGVAIYQNAAYYCTGSAFKTTGMKPNVINILSTDTIFNQGIPDIQRLNLGALDGAVAQEFQGKIYFAVPTGDSTTNNEVWVLDMTRNGLWILSWPISVDAMWLYEDNSGQPHLLTRQGGLCLELDINRISTPTQDNGVPFTTLLSSGSMVFDKGGVAMFASYITYFKFLFAVGEILVQIFGITEDNPTADALIASSQISLTGTQSRLGYGQMLYSNPKAKLPITYSGNDGAVSISRSSVHTEPVEVDEIVNQQSWSIETSEANCDYLASSVTTTGYTIPRLYSGQ